jgi:hypothetical protein
MRTATVSAHTKHLVKAVDELGQALSAKYEPFEALESLVTAQHLSAGSLLHLHGVVAWVSYVLLAEWTDHHLASVSD